MHYVPLSAVETEGIVPAIAQAIGLSLYSQGNISPAQQLSNYLRDKELLLILDTYEHLLDAAPVVVEILEAAPRIKMLVTTRARLNVPGEQCLMIEGLAYPASMSSETLSPVLYPKGRGDTALLPPPVEEGWGEGAPAVQLFLENTRRVRRNYEPSGEELVQIAQVCRWMEGMPLAILLASSWMELLSPGEIAAQMAGEDGQRLDLLEADWAGAPQRQRSMRAVFAHSWRLLSEREQSTLAALAVFPGGFTADAAREIAGATLRDLLRFVDRSLLQRMVQGRYGMQDLLRRYALEQLQAQPEFANEAHDCHAAYYAQAMQRWREGFYNARQAVVLNEMDAEIGNIRAAWRWALERERVEWLSQMADALWLYHLRRGRYEEGRRLCVESVARLKERVQARPEDSLALVVLALVVRAEGGMNNRMGHPEVARQFGWEALSLLEKAERLGQEVRAHKARTLRFLGGWLPKSRYGEAQQLFEQSLELCRQVGRPLGHGACAVLQELHDHVRRPPRLGERVRY